VERVEELERVRSNALAQTMPSGDARSAGKRAHLEFKAAVLELSDEASPVTVVRYLNASRALDGLEPLPRRPRFFDMTKMPGHVGR
jgi:hypothetical protein